MDQEGETHIISVKQEPIEGKQVGDREVFVSFEMKGKGIILLVLGLRQIMTFKSQLLSYPRQTSWDGA
jgi:hypothetical protein